MAISPRRTTVGQSLVGGLESSDIRYRFPFAITPNVRMAFVEDRDSGSRNVNDVDVVSEHTEAGIEARTINLAALLLLLADCLGKPTKTEVAPAPGQAAGLLEYRFVNRSYVEDDVAILGFVRGKARQAEAVTGCVVSDLGISVNKGGGAAGITGTILGKQLDLHGVLPGTPAQTVVLTGVPTGGTFTLTALGATTGAIPFNATATQVQNALNAALGTGSVAVTGGPVNTDTVVARFLSAAEVPLMTSTDALTTADASDAAVSITVVNAGGDNVTALPDTKIQAGQLAAYLGTERPTVEDPRVNADSGFVSTSFAWNVGGRFQPFHAQDGSGAGPNEFTPGDEPTANTSSWIEGSDKGLSVIEGARTSTGYFHSAVAIRPDGQGLQIHARAKVGGLEDFGSSQGAYGYTPTFTSIHDEAWGGSQLIVITTTFDVDFDA